jgi:hypothetical protein
MKRSIQRSILTILAMILSIFCESSAQFFQLRLVSSASAWQQQDTLGQSSSHLFGYQTAQLSLTGDHLSFHTYLQGFND